MKNKYTYIWIKILKQWKYYADILKIDMKILTIFSKVFLNYIYELIQWFRELYACDNSLSL